MDEELPFAILRSSRLKPLAKKIELFVRVSPVPKIVLAIDDFRLLRMEFQSASLQPLRDGALYLLSLLFRSAVHDAIIGVPLEWHSRIVPCEPSIQRIMQKQICEQGARDSALRRALFPWDHSPVLFLHWRFQPALDIEYDPSLQGMLLHRPQQ